MLAKEALRILHVTRPTLSKYVKEGTIRAELLPNKRYNYCNEDVYRFLNRDYSRQTVIYAFSNVRGKYKDIEEQIELLRKFCFNRGYTINATYQDINDNRINFNTILDKVIAGNVERIVVTAPDIIAKSDFKLVEAIFNKFNTTIEYVSTDIITESSANADAVDVKVENYTAETAFEELSKLLSKISPKTVDKRTLRLFKGLIEAIFEESDDI